MDFSIFEGIGIGAAAFLIIGFFHPIVIKAEYHFGVGCWWVFLVVGIASLVGSVFIPSLFVSAIVGVFGFSALWSIKELFEQRQRVEKGWFPRNEKRG